MSALAPPTVVRLRRPKAFVWAAACMGILFVLGTLRANSRYFHCAAMDISGLSPCCDEHNDGPAEDAELGQADCCETKVVASLPAGQTAPLVDVAAAPFVGELTLPVPSRSPLAAPARALGFRWGSDPPPPVERQARLMVFLT
ncbi:MAG TPA: hypothetical protein VJT73_08370 [Polyangiaceae bacterium]|nr:hypothetical protein [Polyangiaceae bacterium]